MDRQTEEEIGGQHDKGRNGLTGSGKVDIWWMNRQTDTSTDKQMDRKTIAWQTVRQIESKTEMKIGRQTD